VHAVLPTLKYMIKRRKTKWRYTSTERWTVTFRTTRKV